MVSEKLVCPAESYGISQSLMAHLNKKTTNKKTNKNKVVLPDHGQNTFSGLEPAAIWAITRF